MCILIGPFHSLILRYVQGEIPCHALLPSRGIGPTIVGWLLHCVNRPPLWVACCTATGRGGGKTQSCVSWLFYVLGAVSHPTYKRLTLSKNHYYSQSLTWYYLSVIGISQELFSKGEPTSASKKSNKLCSQKEHQSSSQKEHQSSSQKEHQTNSQKEHPQSLPPIHEHYHIYLPNTAELCPNFQQPLPISLLKMQRKRWVSEN